jgi:hypothetical protein
MEFDMNFMNLQLSSVGDPGPISYFPRTAVIASTLASCASGSAVCVQAGTRKHLSTMHARLPNRVQPLPLSFAYCGFTVHKTTNIPGTDSNPYAIIYETARLYHQTSLAIVRKFARERPTRTNDHCALEQQSWIQGFEQRASVSFWRLLCFFVVSSDCRFCAWGEQCQDVRFEGG